MIILGIVIIIMLILSVPIKYDISGQKAESSYGSLKVSWLWDSLVLLCAYDSQTGLIKEFRLFGQSKTIQHQEKILKSKEKNSTFTCWDKALLKKTFILLKELLRHIKPETFVLNGKMGLDNPFATGIAMGLFAMPNIPGVHIQPVFDEEIIEGTLKIKGQLVIIFVLWLFIKFLAAKPARNIVIRLIKNKGVQLYG
jgi:hypothetical protein